MMPVMVFFYQGCQPFASPPQRIAMTEGWQPLCLIFNRYFNFFKYGCHIEMGPDKKKEIYCQTIQLFLV
jgi:hypothetical protein